MYINELLCWSENAKEQVNKYKSKKNAPKSMKWAFDKKWTKNVPFKELPTKVKESFKTPQSKLFSAKKFLRVGL